MESNHDIVTVTPCPYCGYNLSAATGVKDSSDVPAGGDISICFMCGGILEFNAEIMACVMQDSVWNNLDATTKALVLSASVNIRKFRGVK